MAEIEELFSFLHDSKLNVIYEALKICLDLTGNPDNFQFFTEKTISRLMELTKEEVLVSNSALSVLINLSKNTRLAEKIGTKGFLYELILMVMIPTNVNADLGCMLLANLSKLGSVCNRLLPTGEEAKTEIVDSLLDIFVKGDLQVWNKSANFDFLAGVFNNITTCPQGCQFFLHKSTMDSALRLTKLMVFVEHSSIIRRGGCVGAIKNICYSANLSQNGVEILLNPTLNLLVYILLPLMGCEDYDDDVSFNLNSRKWKACRTNCNCLNQKRNESMIQNFG